MAKILDNVAKWFNYIPKTQQIVVSDSREITDKVQPKDFVKAVVAKIYMTYQNLVQPRNVKLEYPDESFTVIKNALKVETYLRRSRDRYVELIWKNGFDIIGKNKTAVKYVKRRLKEIAQITEKPTTDLFEEISEQLILYCNVFIAKIRSANSSSGSPRLYFNKTVQPVAGYFILDITKTRAKLDNVDKHLTGWIYEDPEQYPYPQYRDYDFRDIIQIAMSREPGKIYGEPFAVPVLNDIRALRRMEENVEILVFQHAIPLFHYSVGTEAKPAIDGEVDAVRNEVENMLTQGMLVTPERHKILAVGAQREALQVNTYLEYYKTRVLTGLGHSTITLGESSGASRATAGVLSKSVIEAAIKFQRKIKTHVDDFIINELLQEGGFDIFDEQNKVELYIPEIDLDDKIRKEFHAMSLWQNNLLTESEARKELGKDPFTASERNQTFFELITKPKTLMMAADEPWLATFGTPEQKAAAAKQQLKTVGQPTGGAASAGPAGAQSNKAIANKAIPQNQHGGRRSGPVQRTGGDSVEIDIKDEIESIENTKREYLDMFLGQYYAVQEDIYQMIDEKSFTSGQISMNVSKNVVIEKGSAYIVAAYKAGVSDAGYIQGMPVEADLKMLHGYHLANVNKFFTDILGDIDASTKTKDDIINIFDSQKYRVHFMVDWYVKKSYWLAVASSLRSQGYKTVKIKKYETGENDICSHHDSVDLTSYLYMYKIPPYHGNCQCEIEF